jgi:hypothetical protein
MDLEKTEVRNDHACEVGSNLTDRPKQVTVGSAFGDCSSVAISEQWQFVIGREESPWSAAVT